MKTLVIAGNNDQAMNWIKNDISKRAISSRSISDYTIIHRPSQLRGLSDPHGVFVGAWKERADILEILETLCICSHAGNDKLKRIREDVLKEKPFRNFTSQPSLVIIKDRNLVGGWQIFDTNPLQLEERAVQITHGLPKDVWSNLNKENI